MEAKKDPQPHITDQLKEYVETRLKLAKYQAIESGTSIVAGLIADVVVAFCMVLAFIFASITLAYYLSEKLGSDWAGFGCVGAMYLLIAIIVKLNRKSLERPIINAFIQKFFK